MGNLSHEVMCLRFFGDDLDPRKLSSKRSFSTLWVSLDAAT